jgi:valyl-tRNA synthetase
LALTNKTALMTLGRLEKCDIGADGDLMKCAVSTIVVAGDKVKIIIPLEGLVDFNEEIKRIQKTIEKLEKDVAVLSIKLSNEKFVANADEDVIANDRILMAQSKEQVISMKESLIRFQ